METISFALKTICETQAMSQLFVSISGELLGQSLVKLIELQQGLGLVFLSSFGFVPVGFFLLPSVPIWMHQESSDFQHF